MMTFPLLPLALLCASATCAVAGGYVMFAMVGRVNRRLPDDQQISYLWGTYSKQQRVLKEYKRLYPDGRLDGGFFWLVALMFALGISAMLVAVYIGPS